MTKYQIYLYLVAVFFGKEYEGTHTDFEMESRFKLVERCPDSNLLKLTELGKDLFQHPGKWFD